MKIALVSNTSFNIYNFRLGLIRYLQSKGHEVIYISPPDEYVEKLQQECSARYFPLKHMKRKGYNPFMDILLTHELYRIFKKEKVDCSLSYTIKPNIYSVLAARFSGTRAIANITGLGYAFLKKSLGNAIAKKLFRWSMPSAAAIVFQNTSDQEIFLKLNIASPDQSLLIPGSGINTEKYIPVEKSKEGKSGCTFLFVGRLLYDKGIREYVKAAQRLHELYPAWRFHIVGGIDEGNPSAAGEEELNQWLAENSALVHFGHQTQVKPFLEDADIVVMPSYREGLPRVLLEAMAMELPFVTTRTAGCQDVTEEGKNGLLVSVGSDLELEDAMKTLGCLPQASREQMGAYGRKLALEKYDEKIIVQAYLQLLLRLT